MLNILFFLIPKNKVAYLYDDFTLRQALEKMEYHKYSAVPILNRSGKYVGTVTEGDILWYMKKTGQFNLWHSETISLSEIDRRLSYEPVRATSDMFDLIEKSMNQNFVPVVDDGGYFIGMVTRKDIIEFCYKNSNLANYGKDKKIVNKEIAEKMLAKKNISIS